MKKVDKWVNIAFWVIMGIGIIIPFISERTMLESICNWISVLLLIIIKRGYDTNGGDFYIAYLEGSRYDPSLCKRCGRRI